MEKLNKQQEEAVRLIEEEIRIFNIHKYLWDKLGWRFYLQAEDIVKEKNNKLNFWQRLDGHQLENKIKSKQLELFETYFMEKTKGVIF